jgi:hypothetical protein
MPKHVPFRLNRSGFLLALVSAAFAGEAGAAAGRVDFTIGGATVSGESGQQRPLLKGAELDTGDTVRTSQDGRAQIRFTDGAYVSLQPNTEFSIKDYNFQGKTDGSERGLFGLAKGAMRTVTGLIGRVNKNKYAISTPTATIGIRGTGGRIEVLNDGSTLVNGTSGIWTLTNPAGTIDIPAGLSGRAPTAPNQPPQQTSEAPRTGPAPVPPPPNPLPIEKQVAEVCQTNPTAAACTASLVGTPVVNPNPPLVTGRGYAVSYAYGALDLAGALRSGVNSSPIASATFDAAGKMTQFSGGLNSASFTGTHLEFGTSAGVIAWGRWIGPASVVDAGVAASVPPPAMSLNPNANQGYHYVVGVPTAVMPTSGTATYALLGATSPTYANGGTAPGTFSGSLSVTFGTSAVVNGSFNVAMPDRNYALTGSATASGATFSMLSPTVTGCLSACSAAIQGFFAGATAERAGISYRINDLSANIIGAAAFAKQ